MRLRILVLLALMILVAGCTLPGRVPPTGGPTSPSQIITSAAPTATSLPGGNGPCEAQAADITVFTRPSLLADEFGTLSLGMLVTVSGRTADGWLGFDPGVAQAANIGVFRLRWIPPGNSLILTGDCASVPVVPWVPEPGVCYQMSMEQVDVYNLPDSTEAPTGVLDVGAFAAVDGRTASGWLLVNGVRANTPDVFGYIPGAAANLNGACDAIPEIVP
jgi:hypothetical protein